MDIKDWPMFVYDESDKVNEWCPKCDTEVELEPELKLQTCPSCKETILPCSMCNKDAGADCRQCPIEVEKVKSVNQKIEIDVTEGDRQELMEGGILEWTFQTNTGESIDLVLFDPDLTNAEGGEPLAEEDNA